MRATALRFLRALLAHPKYLIAVISKRKGISLEDLTQYCVNKDGKLETEELLKTGTKLNLEKRKDGFLVYYHENGGLDFYEGEKAHELVKPYLNVDVDKDINEFNGLVVSRGKNPLVVGNARIILSPKKIDHMKTGDILVASMTSPDFIVAMKKASAVITDEGGMTCHAAIVSRELGIPCIVATKIATKVLKDGDIIEVNAEHGQVKIIDRKKEEDE